jgi:hypothetical protein
MAVKASTGKIGPSVRVRKPVAKPLLQGANRHAFEQLKKQLRAAIHGSDVDQVLQATKAQLKALGSAKEALTLVIGDRQGGGASKTLAQILREASGLGRLPTPAAMVAGVPKALRKAARKIVSAEALPGEFRALEQVLAAAKPGLKPEPIITAASHQAAKRLGYELPELYQFLYPLLQRQMLKRPEHAGQFYNLFGWVSELGLHRSDAVRNAEEAAVAAVLKDLKIVPEALPAGIVPKRPRGLPKSIAMTDPSAMLARYRPAPGLLDLELQGVRDAGGQLVTDRLRGILNLRKQPPEFIIVSIGESKAQSGYNKIIDQLTEDVPRLLQEFQTPLDGVSPQAFVGTQVRFGPKLVVAWLSERAPPAGHVKRGPKDIAAVFRRKKLGLPDIETVSIPPGTNFSDARTVSREIQAALNALWATMPR